MGKELPYSACGAECYSEFCLFEEVRNVGGLIAYVGEGGPLMICISGCCWSCWVLDGGFMGFDREGIVI